MKSFFSYISDFKIFCEDSLDIALSRMHQHTHIVTCIITQALSHMHCHTCIVTYASSHALPYINSYKVL